MIDNAGNSFNNKKRVLIISQKFNVGHVAGLQGWYKELQLFGFEPFFSFCDDYSKYFDESFNMIQMKNVNPTDYCACIIFNLTTKDSSFIKWLKRNNKAICVVFVHHEPWRGFKEWIKSIKLGPFVFAKVLLKFFVAKYVIKQSDLVVCLSDNSLNVYKKNEFRFNNNCCKLPILNIDAAESEPIKFDKDCFAFLSTASLDKSIDKFFDFIKYCDTKTRQIRFKIVTKSDVSRFIDASIKKIMSKGYLDIVQGKPLTEKEMNDAYNSALCTWFVYRVSSNSGALVKAFMWGSVPIATNSGVFSNQINGKNGCIVDAIDDFETIYNSFFKVVDNKDEYICNSRKTFEKLYSLNSTIDEFSLVANRIKEINNDYHKDSL